MDTQIKDREYQKFIAEINSATDKVKFYEDYCRQYPNLYSQQGLILWALCKEFVAKDNTDKAFEYIKQYIHLIFSHNNQLAPKGKYFSFRGFSPYALPSIKDSKISLVHPRNFNDPFDPIFMPWLDNIIRRIENKRSAGSKDELETYCLLRKACELVRVRCLVKASLDEKENTIEKINPLMWAHYASCHTGFCSEYLLGDEMLQKYNNKDKFLKLVPVLYDREKILDNSHIELTKALTHKDPIWKYENEFRLIYFDMQESNENVAEIDEFVPDAIFLGCRCSTENELAMRKAIHNKNIKLFRMEIDPSNCTKLKKIRIL